MKIVENVLEADEVFAELVLTIGSFDGVHLGHRRILGMLLEKARMTGGTAALMTLSPHPREFFAPESPPNLLTPDSKKFELIEQAGVDVLFVLPFDERAANMKRRDFVVDVVHAKCHARQVIVGHDFHFGRDAQGDYHYLKNLGEHLGIDVAQAAPLYIEGERVSSTAIRESLLQGDLEKARLFLGRPYSIVGEVIAGRGIGHELGFPTANIKPYHTAVPAQGVYAAEVIARNQTFPAAVNIGIAPTIRQEDVLIEAHLLDFAGDLRGSKIEVVFLERLRPECRFKTREQLTEAIRADVDAAKKCFQKNRGA